MASKHTCAPLKLLIYWTVSAAMLKIQLFLSEGEQKHSFQYCYAFLVVKMVETRTELIHYIWYIVENIYWTELLTVSIKLFDEILNIEMVVPESPDLNWESDIHELTNAYMPTLPIYAVVYRFLSLLPPTDFRKKKNVKKIIVNCSYVDYSCRFLRRINPNYLPPFVIVSLLICTGNFHWSILYH